MSRPRQAPKPRRGYVEEPRARGARPSDAQLRSAADRIRRLSAGVMDPDEEAADLTTFAEEAMRRTYRIIELGVQFWMDLLRLEPRELEGAKDERFNSGWLYGRALGATIRSWGDLKNAERGHIWFDSSPLLGPRMKDADKRSDLVPVPRLLTESAVHEIAGVLATQWPEDWEGGTATKSRELFWLGLASGALERELRNPQVNSEAHLERRKQAAIAFLIERDSRQEGDSSPDKSKPPEPERSGLLTPSRTAQIDLTDRLQTLRSAQGGRDVPWRPLYSFLRRGDVVLITLASERQEVIDPEGNPWGKNWQSGRPLALAIVTARPNWDRGGWWGRIGAVLFLDGPGAEASKKDDPQRLRTAFRFPDPAIDDWSKSELALSFGFREANEDADEVEPHLQHKSTNDLGLERFRLYRNWVDEALVQDGHREAGEEKQPPKGAKSKRERLSSALAEPIPVGFAGPWRNAPADDLRATLGEFLDPHTFSIEGTEALRELSIAQEAGFQANLNIERFALTSENVRLGVFFDQPVRKRGRASAQRIAPDPLPDAEAQEGLAFKDRASKKEGRRIDVANAHRWAFDNYKRGREVPGEKIADDASDDPSARRATSFMPAIRLDRAFNGIIEKTETGKSRPKDLSSDQVFLMWTERELEWEPDPDDRKVPVDEFVTSVSEYLDRKPYGTICAAFPESEKDDLDRATFSRAFRQWDLEAEEVEQIPIDPAGTRTRRAILITKKGSGSRLLIILTDDSVAAVDLGAIVWLLLAYDELEEDHVLDVRAHAKFLEQDPEFSKKRDSGAESKKLQEEAWRLLSKCVPQG